MAQRMYKLARQIPRSITTSGRRAARSDPNITVCSAFMRAQRMSFSKMPREARMFGTDRPFGNLAGKVCLGVGVAAIAGGLATGIEVYTSRVK